MAPTFLQLLQGGVEHGLAQPLAPSAAFVLLGCAVWALVAGVGLSLAFIDRRR